VIRFRVPATPAAARRVQERMRKLVVARGNPEAELVAGVDVSEKADRARAAIVVLDRALRVVEEVAVERPVPFPYIPGLLSFREIPPLLAAWRRLKSRPGLVVVDGQGLAHPRRFGLACHLGVLLDLPTIGCAKSWFIGDYAEPGRTRGAWSPLTDGAETIGAALRTRDGCNVVYVSVGHRIALESAVGRILDLAPRFRLPEPQRLADQLSKRRAG
jgi:deoxyribonuclease V